MDIGPLNSLQMGPKGIKLTERKDLWLMNRTENHKTFPFATSLASGVLLAEVATRTATFNPTGY